MLYIVSLVPIYLITGRLYLLTTFLQFPLTLSLTYANPKSNLFFYDIVFVLLYFIHKWDHREFVFDSFHLA